MYTGSNNKFQKPVKTKFRKTHDVDENKTTNNKQKHNDRTLYRMMKEEKKYVLQRNITETNS